MLKKFYDVNKLITPQNYSELKKNKMNYDRKTS